MRKLKVLIGCEESQAVTKAFRELGHESYSCDILPSSGGHPEFHLQTDVFEAIKLKKWDLIIAFPPCTFLTVTGNRWFNINKYGSSAIKRLQDREDAINFFLDIVNSECNHIAIENPVGVMSSKYRKADQIINPYQFGDPFEKKTCLWLKNLPLLQATNIVDVPKRAEFKSGKSMPQWYADCWKLPPAERSKMRSKTFPGIANAFADQYSKYILSL